MRMGTTGKSTVRRHGRTALPLVAAGILFLGPAGVRSMSGLPQTLSRPSGGDPADTVILFNGKTLDGWAVTPFRKPGPVTVDSGAVILGAGTGCTGITWQKDFPTTGYEVELEAMRVDGDDFFCGLTFPVGGDPCTLIAGGWGGSLVGLSCIDELDASENFTGLPYTFKNGRWYRIRLRVTKENISVWIDGKQWIDADIVGRQLSIRWEVDLSRPFGFASWYTTAALRNITLKRLPNQM